MFLLANMVLSKGSLKIPRATIFTILSFYTCDMPFLERVERSRTVESTYFQSDFFNMKNSTL